MTQVLLATDSDSVHSAVDAALGSDKTDIARVRTGVEVRAAVREQQPDVVICDLQIGNMGGMATCLDLRLEAEMGRVPETRVLMLLDREADAYLAKQSRADGWLVKPLDAVSVQRAVLAVLS
ncbi:response regulator [Candidatus Poriferisocius sp.]|uniref:response regulator n=1 Tax=Candidatus Poriferisocius sp. TaxID=3101276 RepID=UPI003B01B29E